MPVSLLFVLSLLAVAPTPPPADASLAELFRERNLTGTLVLASLSGEQVFVHDPERAATRFCPASTFKVPNTLIAIDSGALVDQDSRLPWDGKPQPFPDWEKDQTLASAFRVSCVWFYQQVAARVGAEAYRTYLQRFRYGSQVMGADVRTFWLDGSLTISALEQIEFLRRLVRRELGVSAKATDVLRTVMHVTTSGNCALWAKTGWALRVEQPVGWYVGYVEASGGTWLFAMNMPMLKLEDGHHRKELVLAALTAKGICAL